ncbi:hypothetical protein SKAU_G00210230 [Synaphobranchus kaupii]|uniref:Uncharacterized protein n=1 Tax=Synaphobranchus kaupii TaxID=118154 RepID=A0A9Q1F8P8_SYNKA|nr:hypothetical protein SKAU_G00210230 [Synaphobranchus kaupii]
MGVDLAGGEIPSTSPEHLDVPNPCSPGASNEHVTSNWRTAKSTSRSNPCQCRTELIELERQRLDLKRQLCKQRESHHKELVELKKAKLDIMAKQLMVSEAEFQRPAISMPIILPNQGEDSTT